jgi:hypothetical protein
MGPSIAWAFKNDAFYIASNADYLKQSLDTSTPNLFDSIEFKELMKKAAPAFGTLQYADYSSAMDAPLQQLAAQGQSNPILTAYFSLLKNLKMLEIGSAQDGLFVTETFMEY